MSTKSVIFSNPDDVIDFVKIVEKYPFDMDMKRGRYIVDASSRKKTVWSVWPFSGPPPWLRLWNRCSATSSSTASTSTESHDNTPRGGCKMQLPR